MEKFLHFTRLRRLTVQSPQSPVQGSRKSHPTEIRRHQPTSQGTDPREAQQRHEDSHPKKNNHDEGGKELMGPKEDRRPRRVERELNEVEGQRFTLLPKFPMLPHPPRGDGHGNVKKGPDRTE